MRVRQSPRYLRRISYTRAVERVFFPQTNKISHYVYLYTEPGGFVRALAKRYRPIHFETSRANTTHIRVLYKRFHFDMFRLRREIRSRRTACVICARSSLKNEHGRFDRFFFKSARSSRYTKNTHTHTQAESKFTRVFLFRNLKVDFKQVTTRLG